MADKTLLIGNGLNQLGNSHSWSSLLDELVEFPGKRNPVQRRPGKPFTFLFEEIYLQALASSDCEEQKLKEKVAEISKRMEPGDLHRRVYELGCSHIVTTNYDYSLEKAYLNGGLEAFEDDRLVRETRYSLFRRKCADRVSIWHIHGEQSKPNSIALGFDHYSGHVQKIRDYVFQGLEYTNEKVKSLMKRLKKKEKQGEPKSWVDLFFTSDIYIIGLGMDFVEQHLWWLLVRRARQILSKSKKSSTPRNRIVYLFPEGDFVYENEGESKKKQLKESRKNREELLQAAEVKTKHLSATSWEEYYEKALDWVEEQDGQNA